MNQVDNCGSESFLHYFMYLLCHSAVKCKYTVELIAVHTRAVKVLFQWKSLSLQFDFINWGVRIFGYIYYWGKFYLQFSDVKLKSYLCM